MRGGRHKGGHYDENYHPCRCSTGHPVRTAFAAAAEDCAERGALDVLYCDANGDLVADTPTDPAELSNPDTLVFAYTPVEDPAVYADIWEPFIAHLEETTGKDVQFFAVQSNLPRWKLCALAVCMWRVSPPVRRPLR